ncbi:acetyltransferase [Bacillus sp. NPDC093026]|uniref:acetyltransferase n=1 Tax=Bacillus sp. NPDC093026 TaxID=3363948 RepID=UPI0037F1D467
MQQLKNLKAQTHNPQKIVLIGAGGHSKVIQDLILSHSDHTLVAILDDQYEGTITRNDILYGPVSISQQLREDMPEAKWLIAIGQNETRQKVAERLTLEKKNYATLIHPAATISPSAMIERGTVIMAKAVVQADAKVGEHTIINTGAVVEHDCSLSSFVHLSPGAILTGHVSVCEGAHIGAGAVVIPGKSIGRWSVIGAGAAVTSDIQDDMTAVGVPAIVIKDRWKGEIS